MRSNPFALLKMTSSQVVQSQARCFGAIVKPDPDFQFLAPQNRKTMVLTGMKASTPYILEIKNDYKHLNGLPFFHHQQFVSQHHGGVLYEDEKNTHDLPFGYEIGDDPFDPQGKADYPIFLIVIAAFVFIHFNWGHFRFDDRKVGEVLYHQRLTAFQIEDEIKRIREEDHPIREAAGKQ